MARRNSTASDILVVGLLGFIGYHLGIRGHLGEDAQEWLVENVQRPALRKIGIKSLEDISPQSGFPKCAGPFSSLPDLILANPNIYEQIQTWQSERRGFTETPYDWETFRRHAVGIHAPDPGPYPPEVFCQ